jgi:hypothetical protein
MCSGRSRISCLACTSQWDHHNSTTSCHFLRRNSGWPLAKAAALFFGGLLHSCFGLGLAVDSAQLEDLMDLIEEVVVAEPLSWIVGSGDMFPRRYTERASLGCFRFETRYFGFGDKFPIIPL